MQQCHKIKISTVIPVYNAEKYIKRCLDSILNQPLEYLEIICVDDGSTDGSLKILRDYERCYDNIKVITQNNQYSGLARNNGLKIAQGEYIHFMDSDDYLYEDIYPKIYEFACKLNADFVKAKASRLDLMTGEDDITTFYHSFYGMDLSIFGKLISLEDYDEALLRTSRAPWMGIIRRDFLISNNIKFNNLKCSNDRSFYINLITKTKNIALFNDYIIHYQINNPNSLVGERGKYFDNVIQSYNIMSQYIKEIDYDNRIKKKILRIELEDLLHWFIKLTDTQKEQNRELIYRFFFNFNWDEVENISYFGTEQINKFLSKYYDMPDIMKLQNIMYELTKYDKKYIYGVGAMCNITLKWLKEVGIKIDGILVSDIKNNPHKVDGINIYSIDEIVKEINDNKIIFISTNSKYHLQIYNNLKNVNYKKVVTIEDKDFGLMEKVSIAYQLLDLYKLVSQVQSYSKIYIYGAGMVGKFILWYLIKNNLSDKFESFIVSNVFDDEIDGEKIQSISEVNINENSVVLVAATTPIRNAMLKNCKKYGIKNFVEINVFDDRNIAYYASLSEIAYPVELKYWYKMRTGKELDLDNPKTFNEKIQWLKLYDRNPLKTQLTDKYLVRKYVKEKIGEQYLIPLLGVWNKFDDIDFNKMPEQFVLKCNHGCNWNIIVKDKSKFNIQMAKGKFDKWLGMNFAYNGFQLQYKDIKPKIIAEQYLENENTELLDYKFWCFNGKVAFIQIDRNRFIKHVRRIYSTDWKPLNFNVGYPTDDVLLDKPIILDKMITISEKLSSDFSHVRVDLYYVNKDIYFGELTFTHGNGTEKFEPEITDMKIGCNLFYIKK